MPDLSHTVPLPVQAHLLHPLAQRLLLLLIAQHASTENGTVCMSAKTMQAWGWWDRWKLERAGKALIRAGYLTKLPHAKGAIAHYRLSWIRPTP